jgi:hypothetical protein
MNSTVFRLLMAVSIIPVAASRGEAQILYPNSPRLGTHSAGTVTSLPSNAVSHIATPGSRIWIGTGKGVARSDDGARSWESFSGRPEFGSPGIFAIVAKGDTIWSSTGYTKNVDGSDVQTGSGFAYTLDNGTTWHSVPQPLDARGDSLVRYGNNTLRFLPIVVPEQNVTFGISLSDSAVWVASWSSGLRKSTDLGATWQRLVLPNVSRNSISPLDSLGSYVVDPRNGENNFLAFSVLAIDNRNIWAGTAGGINKSTDGGVSWTRFTVDNELHHILGDWVIALAVQTTAGGTRIWATNWPGDGANQGYGISYTDDGGTSWKTSLAGVKAYDIGVHDSIVYVSTIEGLFRSADGGLSWNRSGSIYDQRTRASISSDVFYAARAIADTVYAGTADGLVSTVDNAAHPFGQSWNVYRAYVPVSGPNVSYAYPNPFSPRFEKTRIHYSSGAALTTATVEVFDFGMNRVRTVVREAARTGPADQDEIWDGRDDSGNVVPNGVYFYRVTTGAGGLSWGKIMVLQ